MVEELEEKYNDGENPRWPRYLGSNTEMEWIVEEHCKASGKQQQITSMPYLSWGKAISNTPFHKWRSMERRQQTGAHPISFSSPESPRLRRNLHISDQQDSLLPIKWDSRLSSMENYPAQHPAQPDINKCGMFRLHPMTVGDFFLQLLQFPTSLDILYYEKDPQISQHKMGSGSLGNFFLMSIRNTSSPTSVNYSDIQAGR